MFFRIRTSHSRAIAANLVLLAVVGIDISCTTSAAPSTAPEKQRYEHPETRALVALVDEAAQLVETNGEAAFATFRIQGSRWRQEATYIFVLDPDGTMLVHLDRALEGKNQMHLKDVAGRPIVLGLIDAATDRSDRTWGWYHYQWPVPGAILPRWKSSYVRLVTAASGKRFVVGSGMYDDRMERAFVEDMVDDAVARIEKYGKAAFSFFRNKTGPFLAKDAYVFVVDPNGYELVNPAFPSLEKRNVLEVKDTRGKYLVREMLEVVKTRNSGWVEYMWPKPGQSISTQKSTYVRKANVDGSWLLVGAGVYLADAPRAAPDKKKLTAGQLTTLVREGAALFEKRGTDAYPELRKKGSKWFRDDTYFFVWSLEGQRLFHAADPTLEGKDGRDVKDVLGRPYGKMFLETAKSRAGEGWVHYMYPEPGDLFPAWKSTFVKRVESPSGQAHLIGAGIYNMQMDKAFITDVVDRAATLVAERGKQAFDELRDKTGRFVFMDVYVFVDTPDGVERVNPVYPNLEGKDIRDLTDARGKQLAREYIAAAMKEGSAWVEYDWYRPGDNRPVRKQAYVRKVRSGNDIYIVGSGLYLED